MKRIVLLTVSMLIATSAHADLSVVTMPLTGNSISISKFEPAETFVAGGLLVRTTDGKNECLLTSKVLRASNASGIEFIKYLKELNASSKQYLLSCYTHWGDVTQAVITQAK